MARASKAKNEEAKAEAAKNIRTFKSSSDVESFYRFVHENNFRREAHVMLEAVRDLIQKKNGKGKKKRARRKLH